MRGMTLEEVLANPKMNSYFPSPYLAFVSSDNPVDSGDVRRELVRIVARERREESRAMQEAFAFVWREGAPGCFDDWAMVYREETMDDAPPIPAPIMAAAIADASIREREDGVLRVYPRGKPFYLRPFRRST